MRSSLTERHPSNRGLSKCALLLVALRITLTLAASCYSSGITFYSITGADCVNSDFVRVESGVCSPQACSLKCASTPKCRAFTLPDDSCQCKMFLFDECSHRVQSVANCTHQVTVYVRSLPGVQPGRLCPPGYEYTQFGTSYKVVTGPAVNWAAAKQSCSQEAGLSKFADALDADESRYLMWLKNFISGTSKGYFLGGYQMPGFPTVTEGWIWDACNVSIRADVWEPGRPLNGLQNDLAPEGCIHVAGSHTNGIDDFDCESSGRGLICECQSVF